MVGLFYNINLSPSVECVGSIGHGFSRVRSARTQIYLVPDWSRRNISIHINPINDSDNS